MEILEFELVSLLTTDLTGLPIRAGLTSKGTRIAEGGGSPGEAFVEARWSTALSWGVERIRVSRSKAP